MSNRTDFDALAAELIEMFNLDPEVEHPVGGRLRQRLETELRNAFAAGQEETAEAIEDVESELCRLTHHKRRDGCSIPDCRNYRARAYGDAE